MTKPTIRELLKPNDEREAHHYYRVLAERVEAVLRLHIESHGVCYDCDYAWPCPTIRALEGENS